MLSAVWSSPQARASWLFAAMMALVQGLITALPQSCVVFAASLALYWAALGLHEAGHYVAGRLLGAAPRLEGAGVSSTPRSQRAALVISAAGPLVAAGSLTAVLGVTAQAGESIVLGLAVVILGVNHIIMLLPLFPDGKIIARALQRKDVMS